MILSSSRKTISFLSARTTKRFPSPRYASAIQIVRPFLFLGKRADGRQLTWLRSPVCSADCSAEVTPFGDFDVQIGFDIGRSGVQVNRLVVTQEQLEQNQDAAPGTSIRSLLVKGKMGERIETGCGQGSYEFNQSIDDRIGARLELGTLQFVGTEK